MQAYRPSDDPGNHQLTTLQHVFTTLHADAVLQTTLQAKAPPLHSKPWQLRALAGAARVLSELIGLEHRCVSGSLEWVLHLARACAETDDAMCAAAGAHLKK
jgi:hypothetical protein